MNRRNFLKTCLLSAPILNTPTIFPKNNNIAQINRMERYKKYKDFSDKNDCFLKSSGMEKKVK